MLCAKGKTSTISPQIQLCRVATSFNIATRAGWLMAFANAAIAISSSLNASFLLNAIVSIFKLYRKYTIDFFIIANIRLIIFKLFFSYASLIVKFCFFTCRYAFLKSVYAPKDDEVRNFIVFLNKKTSIKTTKRFIFHNMIQFKKLNDLLVLFILLLAAPLSISAQKKQDNPFRASKMGEEAMALHISGFAPLGYHGGKLGVDIPLKIIEKRGFKGFNAGRNFIEWYITSELGMIHREQDFEIFTASAELTYRRLSGRSGLFWQVTPIGVGGSYVIPPFGTNISAPSSGTTSHPLVERKWYVTPSVSIGLGRDFALSKGRRTGLPLVIYGKIGIGSMLPYKTIGFLVPTAELGIGYRFSGLAIATRQVRRS